MESVLHVGCGGDNIPSWLADYKETRLDLDPNYKPDIVADFREMPIESSSYDVIYCSHSLEHVHTSEVPKVLGEFHRVLKSNGRAIIIVPDLEGVSPTDEVLFTAPAGPITGLDMIFGYGPRTKSEPLMAHRTGFISYTLDKALSRAGFNAVVRRLPDYNLLAVAVKP